MKIVIQCAASKEPRTGYFKTRDGRRIKFVAHAELAHPEGNLLVRPDEPAEGSPGTWRDAVAHYNTLPNGNPLNLYPAWRLYLNKCYSDLTKRFGVESVFVLSAGWGLIRSDFLTPQYDITFSKAADHHKRRSPRDLYQDFCHLSKNADGPVVFLGGKDYLSLFWHLTQAMHSERIVFYNSVDSPDMPGCRLVKYQTTTRTNWHYACASDLASGKIELS